MEENRTHYMFLVGDFNAKLGKREDDSETSIGNFSYDRRNERGDTLLNFLQQHNMFAVNSFFLARPQRKWTWISPDGVTKNEIDFIITSHKSLIQNITVLNNFTTGSDHRMVCAKIAINTRVERAKLVEKTPFVNIDRLKGQSTNFKEKLNEDLCNLDNRNMTIDELNSKIMDSIKHFLDTNCKSIPVNESKLSTETLILKGNRRKMIEDGKRDTLEYKTITKFLNKNMRTDLRNYNVRQAAIAVETNGYESSNIKTYESKETNLQAAR